MFSTILHVVQVLSALALIGIILIQQGKGASMGAAFGSGASATVFGARGAGSVLTRLTTIIAVVFFSVSFYMSYLSAHRAEARSVVEQALQDGSVMAPDGEPAPGAGNATQPTLPAAADDLPALPAKALPFEDTPVEGPAPAAAEATTAAPAQPAEAAPAGVEARALADPEPAASAPGDAAEAAAPTP